MLDAPGWCTREAPYMALSSEVVLAAKDAGSVLIAVAYRRSREEELQIGDKIENSGTNA